MKNDEIEAKDLPDEERAQLRLENERLRYENTKMHHVIRDLERLLAESNQRFELLDDQQKKVAEVMRNFLQQSSRLQSEQEEVIAAMAKFVAQSPYSPAMSITDRTINKSS